MQLREYNFLLSLRFPTEDLDVQRGFVMDIEQVRELTVQRLRDGKPDYPVAHGGGLDLISLHCHRDTIQRALNVRMLKDESKRERLKAMRASGRRGPLHLVVLIWLHGSILRLIDKLEKTNGS